MKPIKELWDRLQQENSQAKTMEDTRSDTYNIEMKFSNLSVLELAVQRNYLFGLLGMAEDKGESLEGVIHMVESIQDDLSDAYHFPDEIVYPFSNGYEPENGVRVNYKRALAALMNNVPLEILPKCLNWDADLDIVLKRFFRDGSI